MLKSYNHTIAACFIGYVVQAIVNNFLPLLFLTFHQDYRIPLSQITLLVTVNFGIQLSVDLLSVCFVDRIGYRASMILAHAFSAFGMILLSILPDLLSDPFIGVLFSVMIYAIGGGLLEVVVSPIVEACPTDSKEAAMSLLHAFYCWGHVGVVLISTAFFVLFGIRNWRILTRFWSLIPLCNLVLFTQVPIVPLVKDGSSGMRLSELLRSGSFWLLLVMMICSGASEQAVSQWASAFAESGLGISKTLGDLAGPMAFAVFMGTSRTFYGKLGSRIDLSHFMVSSCILCILSYLCISLSPCPLISLAGCAVCGLSVGIMWPGSFSSASAHLPRGGTGMFALLALGGDLGCGGGPTLVGFVSGISHNNLKAGILAGISFPFLLLICILALKRTSAGIRGSSV